MDKTILNKIKEYFHDNESTKQYIDIISTALERQKPIQDIIDTRSLDTVRRKRKEHFKFYTELHHIIPKSIDKELEKYKPNLVVLTAQEHFRCHRLLIDMCNNELHKGSMIYAFNFMCKDTKNQNIIITEEDYALARELHSKLQSKRMKDKKHSQESKDKMSKASRGRKKPPRTEEHRAKLREAGKRRKHSEETKAKMSNGKKGKKLKPRTEEHKANIRESNKDREFSEEHKANLSKARKGRKLSQHQINALVKSRETPVECYILVDSMETVIDKFDSGKIAATITNGNHKVICAASIGKTNSSGNYNLSTKQYNEKTFPSKTILPNKDYPNTYRLKWRKIKN